MHALNPWQDLVSAWHPCTRKLIRRLTFNQIDQAFEHAQ
jgi:hypothetical protein